MTGGPSAAQREALLTALAERFESHPHRHEGVEWTEVRSRLEASPDALRALIAMEETGGEPDVIGYDEAADQYLLVDCSPQSPKGRRSVCYDQEALESRKKHRPDDSAVRLATAWGVQLLSEEEYHTLQALGPVDTKTSSWLRTPADVRALGGAIFGDYRFGRVFVYHNGAESYYAARGFRCVLRV